MLVIRMQRTGRKGHAMFRVVVQDSRRTPTSGKLVAQLGSYDPHAKTIIVDSKKAQFYLDNGAQPSERVARLLKAEGVKLPEWVVAPEAKQRTIRNPDKRRSTRPDVPVEETPAEPEVKVEVEVAAEPEASETKAEETAEPEAAATEAPAEAEASEPEAEVASEPEAAAEETDQPPAEPASPEETKDKEKAADTEAAEPAPKEAEEAETPEETTDTAEETAKTK